MNRPQPALLEPGQAYVARIAARNSNTRGLGPAAYVLAHPPRAPGPVRAPRLLYIGAEEATVAWDAPAGTPAPPVPSTLVVRYDAEAAVFSGAPRFVPLGPPFANLNATFLSFSRSEISDAVAAAGGDASAAPSRFLLRVVPRTAAGPSASKAVAVDVRFEGRPAQRVAGLNVSEVTATSATLAWAAPSEAGAALEGYEVRYSTDGLSFTAAASLALMRRRASDGALVPTTHVLLSGLVGQYWFQVVLRGASGASLLHAPAGPTLVSAFVGPATNLRVLSVTRPPPPPRTKWTRRAPHPVLIGHAASLTPY